MSYLEACEYIKSRNLWNEFLEWFIEWFENGMENEELLLEHTTILYADSLTEV